MAHLGLAEASIDEVCNRWREIHFIDQGIKGQQPWNTCLLRGVAENKLYHDRR